MSVVAGLLNAIRSAAEDRLPRLVFADWMEDRGYAEDATSLRERVDQPRVWLSPLDHLSAGAWCEAVADIGHTTREAVDLGGADSPTSDRLLGDLATVRAPRLRWLGLTECRVTDIGVRSVLQAVGFPALRVMDLRGLELSGETWAELNASRVSYLRHPPRRKWDCQCDRFYCECHDWRSESRPDDLEADDWLLTPDRADRHARLGRPGRSVQRCWLESQLAHLRHRRPRPR